MKSQDRLMSIASGFGAMRKFGADLVIDFVIKVGAPNDMVEQLIQAACLHAQDKWVLGLPVFEVHTDPPKVFDDMITIRSVIEPVVTPPDQDEHISSLLPENCAQEGPAPDIAELIEKLSEMQRCALDREDEDFSRKLGLPQAESGTQHGLSKYVHLARSKIRFLLNLILKKE